jgi:hypothetical protein
MVTAGYLDDFAITAITFTAGAELPACVLNSDWYRATPPSTWVETDRPAGESLRHLLLKETAEAIGFGVDSTKRGKEKFDAGAFATELTFLGLGFEFTPDHLGTRVPLRKAEKLRLLILGILADEASTTIAYQLAERVTCKCRSAAQVVWGLRYYVNGLQKALTTSQRTGRQEVRKTKHVLRDLSIWDRYLRAEERPPFCLLLREPTMRFVPRCDASKAGFGGWWVVDGHAYFYYEETTTEEQQLFDDGIFTINEFELLAVQWLLTLCAPTYQHECFVLQSDNQPTVSWLTNHKLHTMAIAPIVDHIMLTTAVHNVHVYYEHLAGKRNSEADAISRRDLPAFIRLMTECPYVTHTTPTQVQVPPQLRHTGGLALALSSSRASRRTTPSSL